MAVKSSREIASAVKKLAIVILNFNTKELLKECVESIFPTSDFRLPTSDIAVEIIVVDNSSTDGSVQYVNQLMRYGLPARNRCAQSLAGGRVTDKEKKNAQLATRDRITVKLIANKENLGFAAGNNVGIKEAIKNGADYVMILNSDTFVKDRFWKPMIKVLESDEKIGVVGPKIYFAPGFEFHKNRYKKSELGKVIWSVGGLMDWKNIYGSNRGVDKVDRGQYDQVKEVDNVSGCCLLARAEIWEKAKFFNEQYFMYYEDADFCEKIKSLRYKICYVPDSEVWHKNAGSSKVGGSLQDYFIIRNRFLFGFRWASLRTKIALFRESLKLLFSGREWQKQGVKDFYFRKFGVGNWK